jgi:hypothetical protein
LGATLDRVAEADHLVDRGAADIGQRHVKRETVTVDVGDDRDTHALLLLIGYQVLPEACSQIRRRVL